jgi:hypothetical protein
MTENHARMTFRIVACLALLAAPAFAQDDLAEPAKSKIHECSFRPPKGWSGQLTDTATFAIYSAPKPTKAEISLIRVPIQNPTTLDQLQAQLDQHIDKYTDKKILYRRQATIGGRPAYQIAVNTKLDTGDRVVLLRTAIHRSHLDYYMFDCRAGEGDFQKVQGVLEKSIASFRLEPAEASTEERAAAARTIAALKDGVFRAKELPSETWQGVFVEKIKVGYQVQRLRLAKVEGAEGLEYEADTVLDLKKGGGTKFTLRGSFTLDGRYQKMSGEEILLTEDEKELKYRYTIVLKDGKVTAQRHMNGVDEETSFTVPEPTLLTDVVDVFRRAASLRGKSTYFFHTLNPFENETGCEWLETSGLQTVEDSKEIYVTFATVDRGASFTYWFDRTGALAVIRGGSRRLFHVVGMTREDALK